VQDSHMKPGLSRGQLATWKDERGFGFIQPADGSKEVFLHISAIKDSTRRPQAGDTIYYQTAVEAGKIRACNAFSLGARKQPTSLASSDNRSASNTTSKHPFPILEALLLSLLPLIGSVHFAWVTANPIPIAAYLAMSFLTFALYREDKFRAKRGNWRIPEKTLHLCELAGGWLGGFVAQRTLRHKSSKSSYQVVFWGIVILHLAFWVDWLLLGGAMIKTFFDGSFTK
jgi:uncharacterized membrane protein YsdA (DUF1294 family)/cold shock CspA family protein